MPLSKGVTDTSQACKYRKQPQTGRAGLVANVNQSAENPKSTN